jgi:hypothetical protein
MKFSPIADGDRLHPDPQPDFIHCRGIAGSVTMILRLPYFSRPFGDSRARTSQ